MLFFNRQEELSMNSIEKVSELMSKKAEIALGGGKEKLEKQKQGGLMTSRERIAALLDEGSFVEIGAFVSARAEETAADGVATGYGTVDGRLVYVYSQDNTVCGGAMGENYGKKIVNIFEMAMKMGAPVVGMLDSDGVRLKEGVYAQSAMGAVLSAAAKASGIIPNISIVFGNCAGGSAIGAAMSDFVIVSEKKGRVFVNGPSVIEATTGKKALSDASYSASVSGAAHLTGEDDAQCIELARLLISYIPSNNLCDAFDLETADDVNRTSETLQNADAVEDVRIIISEIADDKAFFEIHKDYADEVSVGFVRLNGASVGVAATNGKPLGGCAMEKTARFVRFCDCFNIPVLTFTNTDGFAVNADEEKYGLARKGAELSYAFTGATVPKVNVIVSKAYGTAYTIFNSKQTGADIVMAYPFAQAAPLDPAAGVGMLYSDRLKNGESRDALMTEYVEKEANIYSAAKAGYVDDIIDPAQTRQRVIAAFEMLAGKRVSSIPRKHDNMPL